MSRRDPARGSLLVIALWLVVILSLVAIALSRYLSTETRLMRYYTNRAQAEAWARAGVYLALTRLALDANVPEQTDPSELFYDWLGDEWALGSPAGPEDDPSVLVVELPRQGRVTVRITDEERKLDLNSADASSTVLESWLGVAEVAQAIVDYRDEPDPTEDRPDVQPPYYAKNGPILRLEELMEVPALQEHPEVKPTVFGEGTVSTQGRLNANTVSFGVLRALKGQTEEALALIRAFVDQRGAGADGQVGTSDDCLWTGDPDSLQRIADCLGTDPATVNNLIAGLESSSSVFRIEVTGWTATPPVQHRIEAIVRRGGAETPNTLQVAEQPFAILAWKEGS